MASKRAAKPRPETEFNANDDMSDSEPEDEQLIFTGENAIEGYSQVNVDQPQQ